MAARHSLSPDQFMNARMSPSYDEWGKEPEQYMDAHTLRSLRAYDFSAGTLVGDLHRNFTRGYSRYNWTRLHASIDREGFTTPIQVVHDHHGQPTGIVNGHHRAIAAMERGMLFVPHTEEREEGPGFFNTFTPNRGQAKPPPPHPGQGEMFPGVG